MNSLRTREGTQRRNREGGREARGVRQRCLTVAGPGGRVARGSPCEGLTHMGRGAPTGRRDGVQGPATPWEGRRRVGEQGGREGRWGA